VQGFSKQLVADPAVDKAGEDAKASTLHQRRAPDGLRHRNRSSRLEHRALNCSNLALASAASASDGITSRTFCEVTGPATRRPLAGRSTTCADTTLFE
jgi:hypothetical protein